MFNTVTIVGVGLIGGSFSLALKDHKLVNKVIGVSRSGATAQRALELGIVDEVLPLEEAVKQSDLIYLAIPVDVTLPVMKTILDFVQPSTRPSLSRTSRRSRIAVEDFPHSSLTDFSSGPPAGTGDSQSRKVSRSGVSRS